MRFVTQARRRLSGLYYGWRMMGLVALIRTVGGGVHGFGFTIFFLPIKTELGLSSAATSLAFSLARAEGAIEGPLSGYLIDRYGAKPIIFTAALLCGIGYILLSTIDSYKSFLIIYIAVISLAFMPGFVHAPAVLATHWFTRYRARALTCLSAAMPVGGAIIAPVARHHHPSLGLAHRRGVCRRAVSIRGRAPDPQNPAVAGEHGPADRRGTGAVP